MLKFNPPAEPENFDIKVRKPGNNWLEKNPDKKRPKDYWSNRIIISNIHVYSTKTFHHINIIS
jgi:hypothetical protein